MGWWMVTSLRTVRSCKFLYLVMLTSFRRCGRFAVRSSMLKGKWDMGLLEYFSTSFRFLCRVSHGFFREKRSSIGVLFNQKAWKSYGAVSCLPFTKFDRDGALSLAACSREIKKSASLSNSTAKSRCVKMRWRSGQDSWMSSRSLTLCCLHLCKADALPLMNCFHSPQLHCFSPVLLSVCLLFKVRC